MAPHARYIERSGDIDPACPPFSSPSSGSGGLPADSFVWVHSARPTLEIRWLTSQSPVTTTLLSSLLC